MEYEKRRMGSYDELKFCYAEMRRHSSPRAVYKIFGIRAADEAVVEVYILEVEGHYNDK